MSSVSSIASYATQMSQSQLRSDVSVAVTKKSMDNAKQQGDAMVGLLQQAVDLGKQLNTKPLSAGGLDVRA